MSEQPKRPERSSGNVKTVSSKMLAVVVTIYGFFFLAVEVAEAIGWGKLVLWSVSALVCVMVLTGIILRIAFPGMLTLFFSHFSSRTTDEENEYWMITPEWDGPDVTVTHEDIAAIGILRAPIPLLHDEAVDDPVIDFHGPAAQRKKGWW